MNIDESIDESMWLKGNYVSNHYIIWEWEIIWKHKHIPEDVRSGLSIN